MSRVFISYSRTDEPFARRLATDLDTLGVEVWIDVGDIPAGVNWSTAIQQGLKHCEVMILILSPESMASRNVENEWQYFIDEEKPIIPVLWRDCDIHFQLRRIQYIVFHNQDYEAAFHKLRDELQRVGIRFNDLAMAPGTIEHRRSASLDAPRRPARRWRWVIGLAVVAIAIVGVLWLAGVFDTNESTPVDLGMVSVGLNAEYSPFEFSNADSEIVGFDIDLMNAIAESAGFEVEVVNTAWSDILIALEQGEFDAVCSAVTITAERADTVDFSNPYFNVGQTIAVAADNPHDVQGPADLAGLRVGVQSDTTSEITADDITGAEVVRFSEILDAFQALSDGELDAVVNDAPVSADIIGTNPGLDVVLVGNPFTNEYYGIAVRPDYPELVDAINAGLAAIIASGRYNELHREWFGVDAPLAFQPDGTPPTLADVWED